MPIAAVFLLHLPDVHDRARRRFAGVDADHRSVDVVAEHGAHERAELVGRAGTAVDPAGLRHRVADRPAESTHATWKFVNAIIAPLVRSLTIAPSVPTKM